MLTKYTWTVYVNDELVDIMTDQEVEVLIGNWKVKRIDAELGLIEFF